MAIPPNNNPIKIIMGLIDSCGCGGGGNCDEDEDDEDAVDGDSTSAWTFCPIFWTPWLPITK